MARTKSRRRLRRKRSNGTRTHRAKKRTIKRKRARYDKTMKFRWV